jgi:alanyl-tRNA synthetase
MKTTNEIRAAFIDYFVGKGHRHVPSSSLVPGNDPTLLFTNSGMVQFKDTFLGAEKRDYTRAASAQRCVRAGGKHNDLDAVGYTARHHTFFEMLGNFSFGDYFKRDAIQYAWELLTQVYGLPADKLWVTVYHTDDEAFDIWNQEIGVPAERIARIGDNKGAPYASDNFWQMADTGPCGPCSEIFFDHGPEVTGGPPGTPEGDGDRYIEIWNLVFMQFDRAADGTLARLPKPCVDTGMGLERLTAVLQHKHNNFEIDLFQGLVDAAAAICKIDDKTEGSLRVIADHIRACSFLIVDGVLPSNEGRGYVLRRIIRRALRHGWKLNVRESFFYRMVAPLVAAMGEAYPELVAKEALVSQVLKAEEERFAETLDSGMKVFEVVAAKATATIPGVDAFRLYDTFGFPVDLTADIARERGLEVDMPGFEAEMAAQRERGRGGRAMGPGVQISAEDADNLAATKFAGYDGLSSDSQVLRILVNGQNRAVLETGESGTLVLDHTPFYAESGGQVGDSGSLSAPGLCIEVRDTIKLAGVYHGHVATVLEGRLEVGARVRAQVDGARRQAIVLNHSATHLLHAALREELGTHVQQKGSLVAPDRLRFDFSHFQPITPEQLARIEARVNEQVRANAQAETHQMGMQEALEFGAMALFGEKYGDHVRVLKMGGFSIELCGGTHVARAGDIGLFKILSEGGISSGVRRIEAITGSAAVALVQEQEARVRELGALLGAGSDQVVAKVQQLLDRLKKEERELATLKSKAASASTDDLIARAIDVGGIQVLSERLEGIDAKVLREMLDKLRQKLGNAVVVLASAQDGKASLVAGVSGSALGKIKAGDVLGHVAAQAGGKGGGRPDMAQGGANDGPALVEALGGVADYVRERA